MGNFGKKILAQQKLLKKNRARGAMGKKSSECLLLLLFYFCCYKISAQAFSHQRKSCRTLKWGKKFRAPKTLSNFPPQKIPESKISNPKNSPIQHHWKELFDEEEFILSFLRDCYSPSSLTPKYSQPFICALRAHLQRNSGKSTSYFSLN